VTALTPWAAVDIDPDRMAAELRRRFPGTWAWLGEFTGSWWAISRDRSGRDRLIEAPDPAELGRRLDDLCGRVVPRVARTGAWTGATGRSTPAPPQPMVSRPVAPPGPPAADAPGGRLINAGRRLLDAFTGGFE
jgi:hypothetical protein